MDEKVEEEENLQKILLIFADLQLIFFFEERHCTWLRGPTAPRPLRSNCELSCSFCLRFEVFANPPERRGSLPSFFFSIIIFFLVSGRCFLGLFFPCFSLRSEDHVVPWRLKRGFSPGIFGPARLRSDRRGVFDVQGLNEHDFGSQEGDQQRQSGRFNQPSRRPRALRLAPLRRRSSSSSLLCFGVLSRALTRPTFANSFPIGITQLPNHPARASLALPLPTSPASRPSRSLPRAASNRL